MLLHLHQITIKPFLTYLDNEALIGLRSSLSHHIHHHKAIIYTDVFEVIILTKDYEAVIYTKRLWSDHSLQDYEAIAHNKNKKSSSIIHKHEAKIMKLPSASQDCKTFSHNTRLLSCHSNQVCEVIICIAWLSSCHPHKLRSYHSYILQGYEDVIALQNYESITHIIIIINL